MEGGVSLEHIECDHCGKPGPSSKCARCHCFYYCDKQCQVAGWKRHKATSCMEFAEMKRRFQVTKPSDAIEGPCVICLEDTIENPVVLDCNHSFCYDCIQDYQQKVWESNPLGPRAQGDCPYCRKEMPDIAEKALQRVSLYEHRAQACEVGSEEWKKFIDLALADIDIILNRDDDNVIANFAKARCLTTLDPETSIRLFDKVANLHSQSEAKRSDLVAMMERAHIAQEANDFASYSAIESEAKSKMLQSASLASLREESLWQIYLFKGDAYVAMGKWEDALQQYNAIAGEGGIGHKHRGLHQRAVMRVSRCCYELGMYDEAIQLGEVALIPCRSIAGIHKYIALSHKANGDIDAARKTISRALLHEAPWNDGNRETNLKILSEL